MIHFRKLSVTVDPEPLLHQLSQHPELWNTDDSWTRNKGDSPIYAADNIVLRYNKTPPGMPPGSDWNRPAFSFLNEAQKIVFDVMRAVPGEHLGKVMISRLRPGERIDWHIDRWPPNVPLYWQRFQIPLSVKSGVRFCVANVDVTNESNWEIYEQRLKEAEVLYMEPGTAWWFNNQMTHAVFNDSEEDRLSMFVDIRPFASTHSIVEQFFGQFIRNLAMDTAS